MAWSSSTRMPQPSSRCCATASLARAISRKCRSTAVPGSRRGCPSICGGRIERRCAFGDTA